MIRKFKSISWKHTSMSLLLGSSLAAMSWLAPAASAASEAVTITGTSYISLSQASLSSSSLQFSIVLHNGGSRAIDFNEYGVRVTDASGLSFTANLSGKQNASVAADQDQIFRFYANIASGETADQLKVDVFRWDSSKSDFMNHLGTLSVADAIQGAEVSAPEEILNLHTIDSAFATDDSVAFQLGQSVRVFENNKWYLYTQLSAKNLGSSSLILPSSLLVRLVDADGMKYTGSIVGGENQSILPHGSENITLKTAVPGQLTTSGLSLEFYYMSQATSVSLGSIGMNASLKTAALGDKLVYLGQQNGEQLSVKSEGAVYAKQADGLHIQTVVTLSNEGDSFASLPSLAATYQFGDAQTSITSTDNSSRNAYLSPKETISYYFNAVLPADTDTNEAQLVLWKNSASSTSSAVSSSTTASSTTASTSATTTSSNAGSSSSVSSGSSSSNSVSLNQVPIAVFLLQGATQAKSGFTTASPYKLGDKLYFSNNNVIDKNLEVSLVELHIHENDDLGYKTAIGKYKITNKGTSSIAFPELQNELIDSLGNSFTGSRQSTVASQIMPGTSYVVSYSYVLPNTAKDESFALNVYDDKSVSQGNISLGNYQVAIQQETESDEISLYPFLVKMKDSSVSWTYSGGTYSYVINLELDINHQDQVIIDSNFSKIEFALVDSLDRTLGSQTMTLTGTNKLVSGKQKITISGLKDEQISSGVKVRIYETVDTPNGTAKRLVKELK